MILSQSLWNNSFIFTANSKKIYLSLFKKGVVFVNDIVDGSGNIKLWESLSAEKELNPTDFLSWYGILNAIPKEWKMSVKNCGMCERNQHVLQNTYCGFTVENSSSILAVGKRKIFLTYVLVKELGNLHQKNFSLQSCK